MNSSRHNAVAAEPRQFKAGTKACRVETRSAKTGSRLRERPALRDHARANGFSPRSFCFVANGSGHGQPVRVGVQALA